MINFLKSNHEKKALFRMSLYNWRRRCANKFDELQFVQTCVETCVCNVTTLRKVAHKAGISLVEFGLRAISRNVLKCCVPFLMTSLVLKSCIRISCVVRTSFTISTIWHRHHEWELSAKQSPPGPSCWRGEELRGRCFMVFSFYVWKSAWLTRLSHSKQ